MKETYNHLWRPMCLRYTELWASLLSSSYKRIWSVYVRERERLERGREIREREKLERGGVREYKKTGKREGDG